MDINTVGILPWAENLSNPYQTLSAKGFEKIGVKVKKIVAKKYLPVYSAISDKDIDFLLLDWVHSFYISPSLFKTIIKIFTGELERFLLKKRRKKIVWNLHNLHRHDKKFQKLEQWHFRRLARRVDVIRVFNKSSISQAQSYLNLKNANKIFYAAHGHYKDVINKEIKVDIRKKFSIDKNAGVLLFVGSIRPGKGLLKFIQTFREIKTDCHLIVAGEPLSEFYEEKIKILSKSKLNIHLDLEYIEDDLLSSYIDAANYIVLPYEYILNSGTLLLALSFGKPILGNKIKLFEEIASDPPNILENLHDKHSLEQCLDRISQNKSIEIDIKVSEHYNWDNIARKIIDRI